MKDKRLYLQRLKHASASEMWYRLKERALVRGMRFLLDQGMDPLTPPSLYSFPYSGLRLPRLDGVASGTGRNTGGDDDLVHGYRPAELRAFETRYRDVFCLDIRQDRNCPDIRSVWEPARLQHIPGLLCREYSAGQAHGRAKEAVFDWLARNPFLKGPHYVSVMECALRIPVFMACMQDLDNLTTGEHRLLAAAVYRHAWWTERRLSLYASCGNHTVAEAMGLILAGGLFRQDHNGGRWFERGLSLLAREIPHQILDDGGGVEQSMCYHRFVLDTCRLCHDFLEMNALADTEWIKAPLLRAERFLSRFEVGESLLSIGDSDDGRAPLQYKRPGSEGATEANCTVFDSAGYTVIDTGNGCKVVFDHGPLGMPPLYNHGHADALSICLVKNERVLLCDPGTYRYNGAPLERAYFKSTRAHNTVCVDSCDQALQETGFIWSHPYRISDFSHRNIDDGLLLSASHDGYARLAEPVWHTREIRWIGATDFMICDRFCGRGDHRFELNFHLHPLASIWEDAGWWRVTRDDACIWLQLVSQGEFQVVRGQTSPLRGWFSSSYGVKEPCSVLGSLAQGHPSKVSFVTLVCTEGPDEVLAARIKAA